MNILFLYTNAILPERGGVQRVTDVLSNYFESKGLRIYYLSLIRINNSLDLSPRQFFLPYANDIEKNASFLLDFLETNNIKILINQSGCDPEISTLAYRAKDINVKIISVINNSILSGINNFSSLYKSIATNLNLAWLLPLTDLTVIKRLLLFFYKLKNQKHYKELCLKSDRVILLTDKFRYELNFMNAGVGSDNVLIIPNPVSFNVDSIDLSKKKNELLYVGRIDTVFKRLDLLLEIWNKLFNEFTDWQLKIVGGGRELESIVNLSKKLCLQRISFEGFQDPRSYYCDASIFCLTSSAESFGMVLLEAMQYSTVPFAFNSYPTVREIIDHEKNGILIPPFQCDKYAAELARLMRDKSRLDQLARAAQVKSAEYSIDKVGLKWLELFNDLIISK